MSPALRELLEAHVVASLLKQERLRAVDELDGTWTADQEEGVLRLGDVTFDADVIGTQSMATGTFVWGWANPSTPHCATADALRRLGEERGIAELTHDGELPRETLDAGVASLLAAGVCDLDAYFLGVTERVAVAFALRHEALRGRPVPLVGLASAFLEVAAAVEFGHRRAFAHYLARPLPEAPASVERGRAVLRGHDATAVVGFDGEGRVAEVRLEAPGGG